MTVTAALTPDAKFHQDTATGAPYAGAKLFTYIAGTTTKQVTYTDSGAGTPNTNPVILDTLGNANVWLDASLSYKFVFSPPTDTDPPTAAIWTVDNIKASGGAAGGVTSVNGLTGAVVLTAASVGAIPYVDDYFQAGDPDDYQSFVRCIAANRIAYMKARTYTTTSGVILITNNTGIIGPGPGLATITSASLTNPVIRLSGGIFNFTLGGFSVTHTGTPTSGGDGIAQNQGLTEWINNGSMFDIQASNNYNDFNLGKAFFCNVARCGSTSPIRNGWFLTTDGATTVPSGSANGPLQWYMQDCSAGSAGFDGLAYSTLGNIPAGSSVGALENFKTYASGHHGVAAYGSATHALHSIRLINPFLGQDAGNGLYLDTYGELHVLDGGFIELAGDYGVELTANNDQYNLSPKAVTGSGWDGMIMLGGTGVVGDGVYRNNGVKALMGAQSGVNVQNAAVTISNFLTGNFGGSVFQLYGISVTGDNVSINCGRFLNNVTAPIFWTSGPTNSLVSACLPVSVNTGAIFTGGTVSGNLAVTGTLSSGGLATLNSLSVTAASSMNGGLTMVGATGITGSGSGLSMKDIQATRSMGVGSTGIASGSDGQLNVGDSILVNAATGSFTTGTINTSVNVLVNNASIGIVSGTYTGNLVVTGNLTTNATLKCLDGWVTRSLGITTTPDGVSGHIAGTPLAFTGASVNMTGALAVTGNVQMASLYATVSAGIGTPPVATTGRVDCGGVMAGAPGGGYTTGIGHFTNTVYGDVGMVTLNFALTGGIYNPAATGTLLGPGTINMATSVNLNSVAYTNP